MAESSVQEIVIQTEEGTFHRLSREMLDSTVMSDEDIAQFLEAEQVSQNGSQIFHGPVAPTGFARVSPTFFARVTPSGFVRMTPTGFARVAPSSMVRAVPSGLVRAVPSGFVRAAPTAFARAAATGSGFVRGWTKRG
jgi:hypothetical protein